MSHCKESLAESLQWWPLACGHGGRFPGSAVYCEVGLLSSSANQSQSYAENRLKWVWYYLIGADGVDCKGLPIVLPHGLAILNSALGLWAMLLKELVLRFHEESNLDQLSLHV
ncbi:hypothetical protein RHMOL_Rhmol13G0004300 [Rhododendron molle]|nr:hypothetical protein RHMOL_Rhmol13G0004300 [Rhododendron molle]